MTKKLIIGLLCAALIVAIGAYFLLHSESSDQDDIASVQERQNEEVAKERSAKADVGVITENPGGTSTYQSNKYRFSFMFPSSWRIGDNSIGYGSIQLMNYPEPTEPREYFAEDKSKIEMSFAWDREDFFAEKNGWEKVTIVGQPGFYGEEPSLQLIQYAVELPSTPGTFLLIRKYGMVNDRSALDQILQSLTWI